MNFDKAPHQIPGLLSVPPSPTGGLLMGSPYLAPYRQLMGAQSGSAFLMGAVVFAYAYQVERRFLIW